MKKAISGFISAPFMNYLFCIFSAYCFVFGITEYFFDDAVWGNQSLFNCIFFILAFFLIKKAFPHADKRTFACGITFSFLLSCSFLIGQSIYWGGNISMFFSSFKKIIITLLTLWGLTIVLSSTYFFIIKTYNNTSVCTNKKSWKIFRYPFIYGILMFLCWLPCYLAYYPGIFAYDIELQTMEALGMIPYSRFHPPLHTFIWDIFLGIEQGLNINALVLYSVFQMLLFAFAFTCVLDFMIKRNYNNYLILGSFLFFSLNPVIAIFSFSPVKDAMLTVVFILFTLELCKLIHDKELYVRNTTSNIRFIIIGILCCLLRNNVIYAFIPVSICTILLLRKHWKRIALWSICILAGFLLINGPLYSALGIEKGNSREMLSVPMQQIAYVVVTHESTLSPDDIASINEYLPVDSVSELYNPRFADPVKNTFITEHYDANPMKFIKLWLHFFMEYPEEYVVAFLNLNIPYWYPDANSVDIYAQRIYIETGIPIDPRTDYVVTRDSKIPFLLNQYEEFASYKKIESLPIISNVFSLSLPIWLLLFGITFLLTQKEKTSVIPLLPALFLWCTFMLGPVSNLRYLLPIVVLYPLYIAIIFHKKKIS